MSPSKKSVIMLSGVLSCSRVRSGAWGRAEETGTWRRGIQCFLDSLVVLGWPLNSPALISQVEGSLTDPRQGQGGVHHIPSRGSFRSSDPDSLASTTRLTPPPLFVPTQPHSEMRRVRGGHVPLQGTGSRLLAGWKACFLSHFAPFPSGFPVRPELFNIKSCSRKQGRSPA